MVSIERESFTDKWERGEYSIDPKDLVKYTPPVEFGTVGIINRESFNELIGKISEAVPVKSIRTEIQTVDQLVFIAA